MQRSLQHHTVSQRQNRSQENHDDVNLLTTTAIIHARPWWRTTLEQIGCSCFELTFFACSQLCLIQVVQDPSAKEYMVPPFWRRCVNLVIWVLLEASTVRSLWVCIARITVSMDLVTSDRFLGTVDRNGSSIRSFGPDEENSSAAEYLVVHFKT